MSSSINMNLGSMGAMGGMHRRPDLSRMASRLFSQLDTRNQGYIEKSDLQSAFSQLSGTSGSSDTSVDDIFSQLDGDSDGKVTKDEMTSGLQKLAETLDSQFSQMRMNGFGATQGMGGMPPPGDDAGFTKDELSSQLEEIGSSDSKRASLISNVIQNFDKADTDGDGKVSFKEAMALDQASSGTASASTSGTTASSSASESSEAQIMRKIMQLMHAYAGGQDGSQSGAASPLAAVA